MDKEWTWTGSGSGPELDNNESFIYVQTLEECGLHGYRKLMVNG